MGCGFFFYAGDCVLFSLRALRKGKSAPFFGGEAQTVLFATGTLSQNLVYHFMWKEVVHRSEACGVPDTDVYGG